MVEFTVGVKLGQVERLDGGRTARGSHTRQRALPDAIENLEGNAGNGNPRPPVKENAGGRLERFIHHAMNHKRDASTMDALAYALGLPDEVRGVDRQHQAADLFTSVITELRSMKASLSEQGVPPQLLGRALHPTN